MARVLDEHFSDTTQLVGAIAASQLIGRVLPED